MKEFFHQALKNIINEQRKKDREPKGVQVAVLTSKGKEVPGEGPPPEIDELPKAVEQEDQKMLDEMSKKGKLVGQLDSDVEKLLNEAHNSPPPSEEQRNKVHKVMHEYKEKELFSNGKAVKDRAQAIAIALKSAGLSKES